MVTSEALQGEQGSRSARAWAAETGAGARWATRPGRPAVSFMAQLTKDESHDAEAAVKSLRLTLFGDGGTRVSDQADGPGEDGSPSRLLPVADDLMRPGLGLLHASPPAALLVGFRAGPSADQDPVRPCRAAVRVARQPLGLICLLRLV